MTTDDASPGGPSAPDAGPAQPPASTALAWRERGSESGSERGSERGSDPVVEAGAGPDAEPTRAPPSREDTPPPPRARVGRVGQIVGPYRLVRPLGQGGFGEVWEASHVDLARDRVALKLPHDRARVEQLRLDGVVQHRLDAPEIVRVLGMDLSAEPPYVAYAFVRGETLAERIARGPVPLDAALALVGDVGRAIAHAHERGVLHLDLKPSNVLVDDLGRARVTDFGSSAAVTSPIRRAPAAPKGLREPSEPSEPSEPHADSPPASSPRRGEANRGGAPAIEAALSAGLASLAEPAPRGSTPSASAPPIGVRIVGTLAYMAPEQRAGCLPSSRADVYALGVLLFETLTGRLPTGHELPSRARPSLPLSVDALYRSMVASLDDRLPDGAAAARALAAASLAVGRAPIGWRERGAGRPPGPRRRGDRPT